MGRVTIRDIKNKRVSARNYMVKQLFSVAGNSKVKNVRIQILSMKL